MINIGAWPTWSLKAARLRAAELVQQIDTGNDPLEAEAAKRAEPTVAEAAADYVERYVSGLASAKPIARYFERDVVPVLGKMKLSEVSKRDLIELIEDKAANTPTAARRLLAYLKVFFDWCADREMIPLSPAASIRPKSITVLVQKTR